MEKWPELQFSVEATHPETGQTKQVWNWPGIASQFQERRIQATQAYEAMMNEVATPGGDPELQSRVMYGTVEEEDTSLEWRVITEGSEDFICDEIYERYKVIPGLGKIGLLMLGRASDIVNGENGNAVNRLTRPPLLKSLPVDQETVQVFRTPALFEVFSNPESTATFRVLLNLHTEMSDFFVVANGRPLLKANADLNELKQSLATFASKRRYSGRALNLSDRKINSFIDEMSNLMSSELYKEF